MDVYLIRHPRPLIEPGICYGRTDLPVHPAACFDTVERVRRRVPPLTRWYTSPLAPCATLARALAEAPIVDRRLIDIDFGYWEFQPWDQLDPAAVQAWTEDPVRHGPPGGESYRDVHLRVWSFLGDLLQHASEPVAVVTHASVIRSAISWALGLPLENSLRVTLDFGAVVALRLELDEHLNELVALS
ncbi:MAG: histidine phosphatase family protein [Propionibacteriaceae bacterium]|jgi:alpha-ribazole phosphatase|nr:histidine phosphatase family protein [Propionibacteriaceae bacterium]